jgi:hypothetical protein
MKDEGMSQEAYPKRDWSVVTMFTLTAEFWPHGVKLAVFWNEVTDRRQIGY